MLSFSRGDRQFLTPDDLDVLQRIFDEEIKIRGLPSDCPEATALAARLIELYQAGITQVDILTQMVAALF
ncbi:hypothetical protein [Sinorhizobium fredii]|uniref:hypothetical protein n=1 Tax=Rhizobium fredii TaxID=380 RepID=UPI0005957169|nr:hypothetical protein [Sinorhizobium fredii]WOS66057.1 hypothetical protein SFGR64A_20270 [Sinorhizobium fredii GR64]